MSFLYTSLLTIGLPLAALPLLIHLINLRRRKRIDWAAMQFLLASQRRNKKWIVLRQFLLLLLRTAAIALAALMLAGPVARAGWASLFGRGMTHHVVLLDDSYSMADQWNATTAFDEAKRAVTRILEQANGRGDRQVVTLLRFSEARELAAGSGPRFDRRPLDAALLSELQRFFDLLKPSDGDAGPIDALEAAGRLPSPAVDETRIAYLISDFRRPQWAQRERMRDLMGQLRRRAQKVVLVQCVEQTHSNLAITRLAPESGIRAAGIETWMELSVANYGDRPAKSVTVGLEQDGAKQPAIEMEEIAPGESATRRFRTAFAGAGFHRLHASLESDALPPDNRRYFATDVPANFPVLIIDGAEDGSSAFYLNTALNPGDRNIAGWTPQIEPASFLRQHEKLAGFAAIALLGVPRLDAPEVAALENYVQAGGGLAVFMGARCQREFYNNELFRDGAGLLPAPLTKPTQLLRDAAPGTADVIVTDHPVFRVFRGQRNSYLAMVKVDFTYGVDPQWQPPVDGGTKVIALLRNGAPLVIEKKFGAGRVVVGLTRLSPEPDEFGSWSNFSVNPMFPVFANELIGYLSATRRTFDEKTADGPVQISLPPGDYLPQVEVRAPGASETTTADLNSIDGKLTVTAPGQTRSGIYEFRLKTRDDKVVTRLAAVNVPVGEGELHRLDRQQLAERLRGVDYEYALASQIASSGELLAGFQLSDAALYTLIAVLLIEQILAVTASYHFAPGKTT